MQDAQEINPRKLFVGNLSFNTTEETVRDLFSEYGQIEDLAWVTDRMTGRFRGLCFVTFVSQDDANAAIEGLNGQNVDGRDIVVKVSEPRLPRERRFNNNRGGYGGGNRDRNFGPRKPRYNNDRG